MRRWRRTARRPLSGEPLAPVCPSSLLCPRHDPALVRCLMRMRIGLVVSGGFDRSGRERVTPSLLWLVERLARRHDVHVFVLHYYPEPRSYSLLGATVHDIGRVAGPPGFRRRRQRRRLAAAVTAHA